LGGFREQSFFLRRQRRLHPGCRERLSRRALSGSAELDRARLSQAHLLQQAGPGRTLCSLGAAEAVCRRASRGLQITPQIGLKTSARPSRAPTPTRWDNDLGMAARRSPRPLLARLSRPASHGEGQQTDRYSRFVEPCRKGRFLRVPAVAASPLHKHQARNRRSAGHAEAGFGRP
jgi:hypothetical protein